ncbi:uncharacterized protein [Antedon mediterranea]|uniref:uncharacterized protein n=1 Tax=Antedon mediterranea TaxID=105859 RepID=UPI003AF7F2DE
MLSRTSLVYLENTWNVLLSVTVISLFFAFTKGNLKEIICEGQTHQITCTNGGNIQVISAHYGRYEPGSVYCPHSSSPAHSCGYDTSEYASNLCNDMNSCSVRSFSMYGDPCPGIYKYMEVDYTCGSDEPPKQPLRQSYAKLVDGACLTVNAIGDLSLAHKITRNSLQCFQFCKSVEQCNAFQIRHKSCYALSDDGNAFQYYYNEPDCALYHVYNNTLFTDN